MRAASGLPGWPDAPGVGGVRVSTWGMCGRWTSRWPGRIWPGTGLALVAVEPPAGRAPEGGDETFSLGGGPSRMKRSVIRRDGEKPDLRAEWRRLGYAALFFGASVLVVVLLGVVGLYH